MKVLRLPSVSEMTGLSRVTIWRKERAGKFPSRVQLGPNSVGWIEEEVEDWIETLARSRSTSTKEINDEH